MDGLWGPPADPHGVLLPPRAPAGRVIAEQDPTLHRLQRALEQDRAIQQMDSQALRDFCTQLAATYGVDNGRRGC